MCLRGVLQYLEDRVIEKGEGNKKGMERENEGEGER